jgi:AraC-like DNA-binding protein
VTESIKKREGFQGQKAIVIPRPVLHSKCAKHDVVSQLYITDIGYYPKAKFHYRERPHGADQHILIYCHEGIGSATIDKMEYLIGPGEFFIIPLKAKHSYAAAEDSPWTIYWIHFKGSVSNHIVSRFKNQNGWKGFIKSSEKVISLFNEMYNQLERGYGAGNLMTANMCFWYFLSTFLFNDRISTLVNINNKDATDSAIDYLGKNIDKVITVDEIAREVNLSASQFSAVFKKKTGFSAIEYFNHLKVQKACQYLLFTELRIKEISQELGIEDQYYFSRLFTKVMGISPNEYRKKRIH